MGPLLLEAWEDCPLRAGLALRYLGLKLTELEAGVCTRAPGHIASSHKARDNQLSRETFLGQNLGLALGQSAEIKTLKAPGYATQRQCCWIASALWPRK